MKMTDIANEQMMLSAWLEAASAKRPTPGGGAVAAVAGALAASMGEMVLNYSIGRKASVAHDPQLKAALHEFNNARQLLLVLMSEDQKAYLALTGAKKLEPSVADRPQQIQLALMAAIRTPQAISATAARVLDLAKQVAPIANRWLLSDLLVCCELAMAAVRSGLHNVRVNLPECSGGDQIMLTKQCDEQLARAVELVKETVALIQKQMAMP
jgi:formiminotetrahydrofolate cyclodeaminase